MALQKTLDRSITDALHEVVRIDVKKQKRRTTETVGAITREVLVDGNFVYTALATIDVYADQAALDAMTPSDSYFHECAVDPTQDIIAQIEADLTGAGGKLAGARTVDVAKVP